MHLSREITPVNIFYMLKGDNYISKVFSKFYNSCDIKNVSYPSLSISLKMHFYSLAVKPLLY